MFSQISIRHLSFSARNEADLGDSRQEGGFRRTHRLVSVLSITEIESESALYPSFERQNDQNKQNKKKKQAQIAGERTTSVQHFPVTGRDHWVVAQHRSVSVQNGLCIKFWLLKVHCHTIR